MQVFVVGGAVRDVLLGREPKDIDFVVVGSTPEEMREKGFAPVGADFPVFLDDRGREFALARTERKVGSGHKGFETEFDSTVTLEDDLVRRDLTINALAVPVDDWERFVDFGDEKFVIDHVDGIQDLHKRVLRHVSEAFREDPLRVLRVARFAARMNFRVDRGTLKLMHDMIVSGELSELTKERVWKEMSRAMAEPFPHLFFSTLQDVNGLEVIAEDSFIFAGLNTRLGKLSAANSSEISRWMSVFFDLDMNIVEGFIEMHKMPSEFAKAIRFALVMHSAFFNGVDDVVEVCNRFRVWKDRLFLSDFSKMLEVVEPADFGRFHQLKCAIERASDIGFELLSPEERESLKGPEIGEAILEKRKEVIAKAMP